jgi:hypothetical protein
MATQPTQPPQKPQQPEYDAGHVPLTEEFDDSKHQLPSATPVVIALLVLAVIVGTFAYFLRSKPVATGRIDEAFAVDVTSQHTVLATVQVTLKNVSEKPITLRNINITAHTPQGSFSDDSASVADFERYFNAFPDLRLHSIEGIARGTKIAPGTTVSGSVIVSLPVTKQSFDTRTGLEASVQFDGYTPLELKK